MSKQRKANARYGFITAVLTFGLILCLMRGEIAGAALVGVFWTFYVILGLLSLAGWLRERASDASH